MQWMEKCKHRSAKLAEDSVVFVTLRSSEARRQIQNRNKPPSISNFWNCCRKNDFPIQGVKVRKAPHPQQIKLNCIGFPLSKKRLRRFLMWVLTLLIGVSIGINIGIAFINKNSINIGVSIGISIIVTIINVGIQLVIVHTSYYENEYVSSRQQSNIAMKIGLGQLVNSIGVPIIVTLISQSNAGMQQKSWLKAGGLVDDVFFIGALNILVPIINFFDPWEQYLRFWRWYYSRPNKRFFLIRFIRLRRFMIEDNVKIQLYIVNRLLPYIAFLSFLTACAICYFFCILILTEWKYLSSIFTIFLLKIYQKFFIIILFIT